MSALAPRAVDRAGGRGPRGWLAAVAGVFVEPARPDAAASRRPAAAPRRPVVAVLGLTPGVGATTVARALGAELARRDPHGAAAVSAAAIGGAGVPLGTPAAARLARALARALPLRSRAVGRLCLVAGETRDAPALTDATRGVAPLVLDLPDPAPAAGVAALVDALVLVAGPATEPALATLVGESLARVGPAPVAVLNRDRGDSQRWEGRCAARLPEARVAAQLALAGREPRGETGAAIARLADLVTGSAVV